MFLRKISHFETVNMAFKRKIIKDVKFDENVKFADDLKFTKDVESKGYAIKFDLKLFVYHNHREDYANYFKTFFRYGVSHRYVERKYKTVSIEKKIKVCWFFLFPIIMALSFRFVGKWAWLLLITLEINKYIIPMLKLTIKFPPVLMVLIFLLCSTDQASIWLR